MKNRILLFSILVTVLGLLVFSVAASIILQHSSEESAKEYLRGYIDMANESAELNEEYAYYLAHTIKNNIRVTLMDNEGNVLGESDTNEPVSNHADRKEFVSALDSGYGQAKRKSTVTFKTMLYYAKKTDNGVIRMSMPIESAGDVYLKILPAAIILMALDIGLCFIISSLLTKRLLKPVREFSESFTLSGQPQGQGLVIKSPYREFEPIARRGEELLKRIKDQINQIKAISDKEKLILDNITIGLIMLDKDKRISLINKSAAALLNFNPETDRTIHYLVDDTDLLKKIDQDISFDAEKYYGATCMRYKVNYIEQYKVTVIIMSDITAQKSADRVKTDFFNNVTHEMNTPLTGINGFAEIMMLKDLTPAEVKKYASIIHGESVRLIELIKQILHYSAIEAKPELGTVDLHSVAVDVAQALKPIADKAKVSVSVEPPSAQEEQYTAFTSYSGVRDILTNLAANAVKYNRAGGYVLIRLERADKNKINITVKDNGVGIPKEHINRVFERFYTVNPSHNAKATGVGLGLAIVKKTAAAIGAKISIKSTPDDGTEFCLTI